VKQLVFTQQSTGQHRGGSFFIRQRTIAGIRRRVMIHIMSEVPINLDEPIGKWVGRRAPLTSGLEAGMNLQHTGSKLRTSMGSPRPPRGVFRFKSHEEANEWWMKVWTRNRPN
jgi:hypothetical protein